MRLDVVALRLSHLVEEESTACRTWLPPTSPTLTECVFSSASSGFDTPRLSAPSLNTPLDSLKLDSKLGRNSSSLPTKGLFEAPPDAIGDDVEGRKGPNWGPDVRCCTMSAPPLPRRIRGCTPSIALGSLSPGGPASPGGRCNTRRGWETSVADDGQVLIDPLLNGLSASPALKYDDRFAAPLP
jgi:hypothetical protein